MQIIHSTHDRKLISEHDALATITSVKLCAIISPEFREATEADTYAYRSLVTDGLREQFLPDRHIGDGYRPKILSVLVRDRFGFSAAPWKSLDELHRLSCSRSWLGLLTILRNLCDWCQSAQLIIAKNHQNRRSSVFSLDTLELHQSGHCFKRNHKFVSLNLEHPGRIDRCKLAVLGMNRLFRTIVLLTQSRGVTPRTSYTEG